MRVFALALTFAVTVLAADQTDLDVVYRIKSEAFDHSKVMEHLESLSDLYGPRLTGSPEFTEAADWTLQRFRDYGLENVHTEKWGPFGRSWSLQKFSLEMLRPRYSLMAAWPLAWSGTTNGPVRGEPILAPAPTNNRQQSDTDLDRYIEKYRGKLRGRIVLISEPLHNIAAWEDRTEFRRYTDTELRDIANAPEPLMKMPIDPKELVIPDDPEERARFNASLPPYLQDQMRTKREAFNAKRNQFFLDEGALALLQADQRARDALTFSEGADPKRAAPPPIFVVTSEQYNRIARLLDNKSVGTKSKVELEVNLQARSAENAEPYNLVGEIPGGAKKDEIIMLGAHFDSWHSGTGATDNGAGSAVMLEVVRILKALNLKMDRTVRIALWSGEEQGLLGSKAYVKEHFGDPRTMQVTAAHAKLSGYFNLDNGSGKIRGVYLQNNDRMRPLFEQWLQPFHDLGAATISIRNTGGTDHLSFDAVGLPGFQFIQDPLDYSTVTHHSSMDTYDHAIPADLMQAAAIIASVVYDAATRPEMLPRKPLPPPQDPSVSTK
jgi:carboxypeptidase Q